MASVRAEPGTGPQFPALLLFPFQGQMCAGEADRDLCCHLVVSVNMSLEDL